MNKNLIFFLFKIIIRYFFINYSMYRIVQMYVMYVERIANRETIIIFEILI